MGSFSCSDDKIIQAPIPLTKKPQDETKNRVINQLQKLKNKKQEINKEKIKQDKRPVYIDQQIQTQFAIFQLHTIETRDVQIQTDLKLESLKFSYKNIEYSSVKRIIFPQDDRSITYRDMIVGNNQQNIQSCQNVEETENFVILNSKLISKPILRQSTSTNLSNMVKYPKKSRVENPTTRPQIKYVISKTN